MYEDTVENKQCSRFKKLKHINEYEILEDNVLSVSIRGTDTTTIIRINAVNGKEKTANHILNEKRQIMH